MLKRLRDIARGIPGKRSPKWRAVEKRMLADYGNCQACGTRRHLEVHHVRPFHLHPELELTSGNLIVLCRRCHQFVGHFDDWKGFNPTVAKDAREWCRKKIMRKR